MQGKSRAASQPEPAIRAAIVYDCLFPWSTGGGERVYRRIAELLVERGVQVDYITRRQWSASDAPAEPFGVVPVWHGDIYDATGRRTAGSAVRFARAVHRHFRRNPGRYDLVVTSTLPVLTLLAVRAALAGARTFVVADWLEVWPWRKWRAYSGAVTGSIAYLLQAIGARAAELHTVNSGFTAVRLRRQAGSRELIVLGLLDLVGHQSHPALETSRPPYILFVGRHIPDKRPDVIPAALAIVRRTIPDIRAVIVGTGPETERVMAEIDRHGVADACDLPGRVDDAHLATLMREAAVLVNPSAREGFGLVVAEAASLGTPSVVVAGEDNAAAALIVEGVNGSIVRSVEPDVLAEAIVRVVGAGKAMRASTSDWFESERADRSLSRSVDQILGVYEDARSSARSKV